MHGINKKIYSLNLHKIYQEGGVCRGGQNSECQVSISGLPQEFTFWAPKHKTQIAPRRETQIAPKRETQIAPRRKTQIAPAVTLSDVKIFTSSYL